MDMHSPDALLAAAQAGDLEALNQLVAGAPSRRLPLRAPGLPHDRRRRGRRAGDALGGDAGHQDVPGSASSIASWLFTIVRRECLRLIEGRPPDFGAEVSFSKVVDRRIVKGDRIHEIRAADLRR
jgi:hypothetical protein